MIIDGKQIAEDILQTLEREGAAFSKRPSLGILMARGNAATDSFVRIKTRNAQRLGVAVVRAELPEGASTGVAVASAARLARECDGVIVQLPLPPEIEVEQVLVAVPPERDIDAIGSKVPAAGRLVRAPVAEAVKEILSRMAVEVHGKKAVVIGEGVLVGKPCLELLRSMGAQVQVITAESGSLTSLSSADIIISGAGAPGLIKPEMIKAGVVLIDAGTSEQGGKLAGDADPACAAKCSVFTPVPGGVGPIAVAMIFKNLFALAKVRR